MKVHVLRQQLLKEEADQAGGLRGFRKGRIGRSDAAGVLFK